MTIMSFGSGNYGSGPYPAIGDGNAVGSLGFHKGRIYFSGMPLYGTSPSTPNGRNFLFNLGSIKIWAANPIWVYGRGAATTVLGRAGYSSDFRVRPYGAFKDFTIFRTQDPVLVGYVDQDTLGQMNNPSPLGASSVATGPEGTMITSAWNRHWRSFIPPRGARYVVPTPQIVTLPAGKNAFFDGHQMEINALGAGQPTNFSASRSLNVYVRPSLINYCPNPNGLVNTNFWSGVAQLSNMTGMVCANGAATVSVPRPDIGETYTISAVVWSNNAPVTVSVGGNPAPGSASGYGSGTYGSGPYPASGVTTTSTPLGGGFTQITATYIPVYPSTDITFNCGTSFNIKNVMVTDGNQSVPYFDGDSGTDYLWEQGGTPQLTRSYWYPGRIKRHGVMVKNLKDNMPFGMTLNQVVYAVLPKPDGGSQYGEGSAFGSGAYGSPYYGAGTAGGYGYGYYGYGAYGLG